MSNDERGFSLSGPLYMKYIGGALTLLRSKKRCYFAIDEVHHRFIYFKDEQDFIKKKDPVEEIPLDNVVFTTSVDSPRSFMIHFGDKRIEFEADNEKSTECWMEALSRRPGLPCPQDMKSQRTLPHSRRKMYRKDRSYSLPSESDMRHKTNRCLTIEQQKSRKYSEGQDSAGSTFALSVLEEKLKHLGAFAHNHPWVEDCDHGSDATTIESPLVDVESAPNWLDDWVGNWLQQQPLPNDPILNNHPASLDTSTATSPYDSKDCSSTSSEVPELDELGRLRLINNRQKDLIHQLNVEKQQLCDRIEEFKKQNELNSHEGREALATQNKFLNGEILRLNKRCGEMESKLRTATSEVFCLTEELERYKREYVFVLQSCIKIPLHDNNSLDIVQVKLYGGDVHLKRVYDLLESARQEDPCLPTLNSLLSGTYVDIYGFRQHFTDTSLAVHYIATQLHRHFTERLDASHHHKQQWKTFLNKNTSIPINKETKALCRAGIPNSLRSTVWKLLIHQQVFDIKLQYGKYYYRNLCSLQGGEAEQTFCTQHQKQINLDLLRTMPNNVHFMSAHSKGVTQLQQVLRAFCLHNGSLGYCQGMNFLAATALLFVGPEDTFWFLIALSEKYFGKSYFDDSLAGAQADQEVLKELLEIKCPRILQHIEECEIELATVTLNWFIALFFDAVPFQTLLRIWDCFLLEGPKVLFRFSVALLGLHEDEILQKTDTIGIMKVVKAAVKLTYDIDGLFKLAFTDINPFPSRMHLWAKHSIYLALLQEKLNKKQQRRDYLTGSVSSCDSAYSGASSDSNYVPISDIAMSPFENGVGYVVAGNQHVGHIGKITLDGNISRMMRMDLEFDCRVVSLLVVKEDMAFASLISGYIVALFMDEEQCTILWELKLNDVALKLLHCDNRIYAALANGTITILENVIDKAPTSLELLHVPVGSAPITDAVVVGENLWLAVACKIVVLNKESLSSVSCSYVACSAQGCGTPFFEKVLCLAPSSHGVFLVTAQTTLVQLWSGTECTLLFDISYDHSYRKPSLDEHSDEVTPIHITALSFLDGLLWVGTSDGYIIMYSTDSNAHDSRYWMHRYPAGRRLVPRSSPGSKECKGPLCYIPTVEEAHSEDRDKEDQRKNMTRRVSVVIDQDTNNYAVHVGKTRSKSIAVSRNTAAERLPRSSSMKTNNNNPFTKGVSQDSAVSVFSSSEAVHEISPEEQDAQEKLRKHRLIERERMLQRLRGSTGSSNLSMDYDDLFELYSEDEKRFRRLSATLRTARRQSMCQENQPALPADNVTGPRISKLRRRDLDFDDPLVVAVQEDESCGECTNSSGVGSIKEQASASADLIVPTVGLSLLMKLKISDRPVRRMIPTRCNGDDVMITCAGNYDDEEALLRWYKEKDSGLWINDPIVDNLATRRYSVFSSTPSSPSTHQTYTHP